MKIRRIFFLLFIVYFSISTCYAEYEKPNDPRLNGTNYRIDVNKWNILGMTRSWVLHNIRTNSDDSFDWANWCCEASGTECGMGDWATRWSGVRTTSPGSGWFQNENGEWEPPLPTEPGLWESIYPPYPPTNYDPLTGTYY